MNSKLKNLLIDFGVVFAGAYVSQLAAGASPTSSLWALLASAIAGALQALNPANGRYGVGSSRM